ncbi:MAG: oligosaccharide flippase family protein [Candidatus Atribacteria bacterium]|nr:oligosaccharide flippase family protein [Candidatus Atribacteria bacterium]
MINKVKRIVGNNRTVFANFSYLTLLQIFNLLLPLVTYPYLIRILGSGVYGKVIFAQAVVMYFSIIINFGFNISATKDVAENRDIKKKLDEIVSSIYILKGFLWFVSLLLFLFLIYIIPSFKQDFLLFLLTFGMTLMELFFPQWYFQGVEKMRYITIINVLSRSLFTVLIFIFVKNQHDYLLVPLFNTIGFFIGGVVSFLVLSIFERVVFKIQNYSVLRYYFKESIPLFLSAASIQVYVNANRVIVGAFLGMKDVAYYDLGEKILKLLKMPVGMLGQAAFPKLSREKNIKLINRYLLIGIAGTSGLVLGVLFFRETIVSLLIGKYVIEAAKVLSILSISALMVAASQFLGTSRMIVFGFRKAFSKIIISSAIFFLIGFGILFFVNTISLKSLAWLAVFVEAWVTLVMLVFCYKQKLLV